MFNYPVPANFAIKFDLKKFYHEIDINKQHKKYFGFMYQMENNQAYLFCVGNCVVWVYQSLVYC
jgi:hypothetical protein